MKRYYIFRHGETFVTNSLFGIGWYGPNNRLVKILPKGIPTINRMANYLKSVGVSENYCSEFLRCKETAQIVAEATGKKFTVDGRLNDYTMETFGHFTSRVKKFLSDIEKSSAENILICTHGSVISAMQRYLLNGRFDFRHVLDYPRPGVLTIIEGKSKSVIDFNVI